MLRSLQHITGFGIEATDDDIGHVHDIFFDDKEWAVRYFVADTGNWLPGRRVLLSPVAVSHVDWDNEKVEVNLTRDQIEKSPPVETDQPVSRQVEYELAVHYAWPTYWGAAGGLNQPVMVAPSQETVISEKQQMDADANEDNHLQSVRDLHGYHIHTRDGEIGHVVDFYADEKDWKLRWLEIDTRRWLPGPKVLLAPDWIKTIAWEEGEVMVDLNKETIKESPEFDDSKPIERSYEQELFLYYKKKPYWEEALV